jgi:hypothetical protein
MKKLRIFIAIASLLFGIVSLSEATTTRKQIFIGDVQPSSCTTGDGWIDISSTPIWKICTTTYPITFNNPEIDPIFTAWDKDYSDLINIPDVVLDSELTTYTQLILDDIYPNLDTNNIDDFTWDYDFGDILNVPNYLLNDNLTSAAVQAIIVTYPNLDTDSTNDITDHGGLTGLTDDDHTQYVLQDGSEVNDFTGDVDIQGSLSASQSITSGTMLFVSGNGAGTVKAIMTIKDVSGTVDTFYLKLVDGSEDGLYITDDVGADVFFIDEGGGTRIGDYDGGAVAYAFPQMTNVAAIYSNEATSATFSMFPDNADDSSDPFQIVVADSDEVYFQVYDASGGSLINAIEIEKYSTGRAGEVILGYGATINGGLTNTGDLTVSGITYGDKFQSVVNTGVLGISGNVTISGDTTVASAIYVGTSTVLKIGVDLTTDGIDLFFKGTKLN